MDCVACGSAAESERPERTARGYRRFRCRACGKQYNERSGGLLNHTHNPSDVIARVELWRLRYRVTLRDLTEMFLVRGIKLAAPHRFGHGHVGREAHTVEFSPTGHIERGIAHLGRTGRYGLIVERVHLPLEIHNPMVDLGIPLAHAMAGEVGVDAAIIEKHFKAHRAFFQKWRVVSSQYDPCLIIMGSEASRSPWPISPEPFSDKASSRCSHVPSRCRMRFPDAALMPAPGNPVTAVMAWS
jgi:hypothetical protein